MLIQAIKSTCMKQARQTLSWQRQRCISIVDDFMAFAHNVWVSLQKFDSLTRSRQESGSLGLFGEIALLLIDEVHLLSDIRGATLEAIVCRLKMLARYPEMRGFPISTIRFIAVSATIPNLHDIGVHGFCWAVKRGELCDWLITAWLHVCIIFLPGEWLGAKGKGLRR